MPFNTKEEIAQRRSIVSEMYLKGYFQTAIAQKLGVTQQQISLDLKALLEQWKASALSNFDEKLTLEVAKINRVELELWEAWERSKQKAISKKMSGTKQAVDKVEQTEKDQDGNPAYLAGVMNCIKQRIELFGLKAPEQKELKIKGNSFADMSTDELISRANAIKKISDAE